jgi:hypothetical protein
MLAGELLNSLIRKKMVKRPQTAWFVGKPGETLNNGKATPKHHNTYNTPESGTHEAHS